jgi:hypothetical protein
MTLTLERIEDIETDLTSRAFLYDDPATFRAAIDLAMQMLRDAALRPQRPLALGSDATDHDLRIVTRS